MAVHERRVYVRLALDAADMVIWDADFSAAHLTDCHVTWSKPGTQLLGIASDGFRHTFQDFLSFVHPEDRDRVRDTLRSAVDALENYALEYRVLWPDQSIHWLATKGAVLTDANKKSCRMLGIVWDITPRKQEKDRLQRALDTAHIAMWEWDMASGSVYWSARSAALFGWDAEACLTTYADFLQRVHPDDRTRVDHALRQAIHAPSAQALEYRIVLPGAVVRWISAVGNVCATSPGKAPRMVGLLSDITDRKQAQATLVDQKNLAQATLHSMGDAVITTDENGKIRLLNRVAEQMTGWPQSLAAGHQIDRVLRIVDEASGASVDNPILTCLLQAQTVSMSARRLLLTRDGREMAIRDSASPIRSPDGTILGAVMVFQDVSHERRLLSELSWQATHDPLTGLINRREFEKNVATALASAKRERVQHALLYMDLDQFKAVNDTCGHVAGDELLRQLSGLLLSHMRDSDILARLGGDEMGVLLLNCRIEQAHYLADDLRQLIRDFRFVWGANQFELGVSIGLVGINENSKPITELMSAADMACYAAKEGGRNRVHLYSEPDIILAKRYGEMMWVSRIAEAFDNRRFRLFSQPIISMENAGLLHSEILLRMEDEHGKLILPGAFIPAAERYDLMPSIDRWVIDTVLGYLKKEAVYRVATNGNADDRSSHAEGCTYSINLSGASLNDDTMLKYIFSQFEKHGVAGERICFDITETAIIGNLAKAKYFMQETRKLGCRFSLDDFGSGLSSFTYLKNLPVDYLKIDGSLIKDIATDPIDLAMVNAINEVGHVMGIKTIAEFVESDLIFAKLRAIGVDYGQGHAVGKPVALLL